MEPIYRQTITICANHVDCFQRVKPSVLLYFIQDAAGKHCVAYGADWDSLAKKNLFWAVTRHRVQISRLPREGETITVQTWPMPTTRVAYPRSVVAYDEAGQEVFRAISLWVLMDTESRAMVLPGKSDVTVNGQLTGTELAVPHSMVPMVLENSTCRRVGYTELDLNGHMNNTRYLDWVDDLLPSAFHQSHPVREFTICYHTEAREGQEISMDYQLLEGPCLRVDAHRKKTDVSDGKERVFSAQILF